MEIAIASILTVVITILHFTKHGEVFELRALVAMTLIPIIGLEASFRVLTFPTAVLFGCACLLYVCAAMSTSRSSIIPLCLGMANGIFSVVCLGWVK